MRQEQEALISGRSSRLRRRTMMGMAMLAPLVFTAGLKLAPLSQANEVKTEKDCNPRPVLTFPFRNSVEAEVFECRGGSFRVGKAPYKKDSKGRITGVDRSFLTYDGKVNKNLKKIEFSVNPQYTTLYLAPQCTLFIWSEMGRLEKADLYCRDQNSEGSGTDQGVL